MPVTAENLTRFIKALKQPGIAYNYISPKNSRLIEIVSVTEPCGPIRCKVYNPKAGGHSGNGRALNITTNQLRRLANAIRDNEPFNIETVFGGSYNNRSVIASLLAHTPFFWHCKPGRIDFVKGVEKIVSRGHRHLIYRPLTPHDLGDMKEYHEVEPQSEETLTTTLDSLAGNDLSEESERMHARMQIFLMRIGEQLGFRTWIAVNDQKIKVAGRRIVDYDSVLNSLSSERVMQSYDEAMEAAKYIDCVWFKNGKMMPAVLEVENSTNITSGLVRMKKFYDTAPQLRNIRWVIVAPDEKHELVEKKANEEQFLDMKVKFFPYSAVAELASLCARRNPEGITDSFLDCFMIDCVKPNTLRAQDEPIEKMQDSIN